MWSFFICIVSNSYDSNYVEWSRLVILEKVNSRVYSPKTKDASQREWETGSRGGSVGCGKVVVFGLSWTASGTPPNSNAWHIQWETTGLNQPALLDEILFWGLQLHISCCTVKQRMRKDSPSHRKDCSFWMWCIQILVFVWLTLCGLHKLCLCGHLFNEGWSKFRDEWRHIWMDLCWYENI